MDGKNMAYNRDKAVNQFLLIIITIMDLFLFFGYFGDYSKGNIGLAFLLTVELTVLASMVADYAVFIHKKDSKMFKHVSMAGSSIRSHCWGRKMTWYLQWYFR